MVNCYLFQPQSVTRPVRYIKENLRSTEQRCAYCLVAPNSVFFFLHSPDSIACTADTITYSAPRARHLQNQCIILETTVHGNRHMIYFYIVFMLCDNLFIYFHITYYII
jgi:hypothetical protein